MKLRFISPDLHGVVDYTAAIGLISLPLLLGLGETHPAALWLSVVMGGAVVLVSLLTDYRLSMVNTIPFDAHLAIDLAAATTFMLAPFIFSLEGLDAYYYWANAAVVYLVVALTESKQKKV